MMSRLWTKSEVLMNGVIRLALYRSTRSALVVAIGDVPGPMVNACMSFATETDCDDGLPHTLEHLVFMGSEKYPFKGVLDVIANRCLASGTNAWTAQDHTAYTLSTVGSEGFFKVLPVYMNHLLSPTLTDSQFATEVHHINGDGENAGVVYSEMQDHESEMEEIMSRKAKEIMYPKGNPYAVDSGGRLENLRDSCSIHKVRDYHKKYYHLSNMMVIVCGKVDHQRLLSIVEGVEEEHLCQIPSSFPPPFSLTISPLNDSSVHSVICPSDDESRGIVDISWFGPKAGDLPTTTALSVMFEYLTSTAVSPLQKDFIHIAAPLASSADFHIQEQVTTSFHLRFNGVPTPNLDDIRGRFFDTTIRNLLEENVWDMERMGFLIDQNIQDELVQLETNPANEVFQHVIGFQLFDKDNMETLRIRVNEIEILRKLRSEPASFWVKLMDKYINSHNVTIIGIPNEKMVDKIAKEERKRIKKQQEKLGKDGLEHRGKLIADAIRENTAKKPSAELLDKLIVENLETFDRFPVVTSSNLDGISASSIESQFLSQFPFTAYIHNCPSKFIELFLLLDTSDLVTEQRAWLLLYNDLLFESPAMIDGVLKSADDVAKLFTKDLIDHSIQVGVSGYYDRLSCLRMKVPVDKGFPLLAKWAEVFTRGIVFDVDRIKQCAQKLASSAREKKRDGSTVASTALTCTMYDLNSNTHLYDELVLEKFHEKVVKMCDTDGEKVVKQLEAVREVICNRGLNAHFICNVDLIDNKQFDSNQWNWASQSMGKGEKFQTESGESVNKSSIGEDIIIPVGGSESAFIYQTCLLDSDWSSPELLPTMLFTQYLSQCEGPLWRGIRGDGLAYGANIYVKSDRKMISLSLYRCAQPSQAYQQSKKIVESIISSGEIDESEFEAAKRSLVYELMCREETVSSAGKIAILSTFRNLKPQYIREACQRIWNMSKDEMMSIGGPRVAKLFNDFIRVMAVHPSKVVELRDSFTNSKTSSVAALNYKM